MRLGGVLRARVRLARNRLLGGRRGSRRPGSALLALAVLALVALVLGTAFEALFTRLALEGAGAGEAARVLALLLGAAMAAVLVFDAHETLAVVLLDRDLELLRRAPVGPGALLALKLLDALPRTAGPLLTLALPAMIAFAHAYAVPAWGWALFLPLVPALWALPLALALPAGVLLLRVVPARRAREALALFSTLALVAVWGANALFTPRLATIEGDISLRAMVAPAAAVWTPARWAGEALAAAASGRPIASIGWALALLGLGAGLLGAAGAFVAARLPAAHAKVEVERLRRRGVAAPARPRRRRGVVAAIVARDARLFTRDWTIASDVLTAALMWTVLPLITLAGMPGDRGLLVRAMLLALGIGLGYEVAGRALPLERDGLAWSRLAPVQPWRWLFARFAGVATLAFAVALAAGSIVLVALPLPPREWAAIAALVGPALVFALALGLWTGAAFGDLRWTSPRAMLTTPGRIVASLLLLAQAGAWFGLAIALRQLPELARAGAEWWAPAAVAALASCVPFADASRRLARLEWSY